MKYLNILYQCDSKIEIASYRERSVGHPLVIVSLHVINAML